MKSEPLLLGIDLGTTNLKGVVTTFAGQVRAEHAEPIALSFVGTLGVEQDLPAILAALTKVIQHVTSQVEASEIVALGISSQGGTLQFFDHDLRPQGNLISWMDRRGLPYDESFTNELGKAWFTEHVGRCGSGSAIGHVRRLHAENPELMKQAQLRFLGDCVVEHLCGRAVQDATSASIALLLNPKQADYDDDLLAHLKLNRSQLPAIASSRSAAGTLRKEVAEVLGLKPSVLVSPAIHDQYAAALAAGAVQPGDVMIGIGTAWVLLAISASLVPPVIDSAYVCPHVVEGCYGQLFSMVNGGSAFAWAQRLVGFQNRSMKEIDDLLNTVPPGCDGLRCWPFLAAQGNELLPIATARFSNLQLHHGPAHLLRSVTEGLVCELARHFAILEKRGIAPAQLMLCGSATSSNVLPQIIADTTGKQVRCFAQGSAFGAAILARGIMEPDTPLAELAKQMSVPSRQVEPGPAAKIYQAQGAEYLTSLAAAQVKQN